VYDWGCFELPMDAVIKGRWLAWMPLAGMLLWHLFCLIARVGAQVDPHRKAGTASAMVWPPFGSSVCFLLAAVVWLPVWWAPARGAQEKRRDTTMEVDSMAPDTLNPLAKSVLRAEPILQTKQVRTTRPNSIRSSSVWWRSCCGSTEDLEPADAGRNASPHCARSSTSETHPKFCGWRVGTEAVVELPSLAAFAPEPLDGSFPEEWDEMLGYVGNERKLCRDLQKAVSSVNGPKDPITMLRFLRARQGQVEKAAAMYQKVQRWHAESGLENGFRTGQIDDTLHKQFDDHWKAIGLLGRDRDGSPVFWERIATADTSTLVQVDLDFVWRHEVYSMTRILQAMEELRKRDGYPHMYFTVVVDLEGLGVQHMSSKVLQMYKHIVRVDEDYYPELVKRVIVVRAPWIFSKIWFIVQHFFDEGTRNKIQIAGKQNPADAISPYIDPSWIPKALGGKFNLGGAAFCEPYITCSKPIPAGLLARIRDFSQKSR